VPLLGPGRDSLHGFMRQYEAGRAAQSAFMQGDYKGGFSAIGRSVLEGNLATLNGLFAAADFFSLGGASMLRSGVKQSIPRLGAVAMAEGKNITREIGSSAANLELDKLTGSRNSMGSSMPAASSTSSPDAFRSTTQPLADEVVSLPTDVPSSSGGRVPKTATRNTLRGKSGPVEDKTVMAYGESKKSGAEIKGDELTLDHIPSGAALKTRLQRVNAGTLDKKDLSFIYQEGHGIVIQEVEHKIGSRTYLWRNKRQQILDDSLDLLRAQELDLAAMREHLTMTGGDVEAFDLAAGILRQVNAEIFEIGSGFAYHGTWTPP